MSVIVFISAPQKLERGALERLNGSLTEAVKSPRFQDFARRTHPGWLRYPHGRATATLLQPPPCPPNLRTCPKQCAYWARIWSPSATRAGAWVCSTRTASIGVRRPSRAGSKKTAYGVATMDGSSPPTVDASKCRPSRLPAGSRTKSASLAILPWNTEDSSSRTWGLQTCCQSFRAMTVCIKRARYFRPTAISVAASWPSEIGFKSRTSWTPSIRRSCTHSTTGCTSPTSTTRFRSWTSGKRDGDEVRAHGKTAERSNVRSSAGNRHAQRYESSPNIGGRCAR